MNRITPYKCDSPEVSHIISLLIDTGPTRDECLLLEARGLPFHVRNLLRETRVNSASYDVNIKGIATTPKPEHSFNSDDVFRVESFSNTTIETEQEDVIIELREISKEQAKREAQNSLVKQKIRKINVDLMNSGGLTEEEIPIAVSLDLIDSDQAYFWLEEWQEGYREAQRDIEEGNYETFEDIDSLLDYLHR